MKFTLKVILIYISLVSCKSNENKNDSISEEKVQKSDQQKTSIQKSNESTSNELSQSKNDDIKTLKNSREKEIYLTKLFARYERTNPDFAQEVALKHGWNSHQYKQKIAELNNEKELVFSLIKQYLMTHGYPSEIGSFNWKAKTIIQNVVKDRRNYDDQYDVLQVLINNESTDSNNLLGMSLILPEMYISKNGGSHYEYTSRNLSLRQAVLEISKELGIETIID